MTWVSRDQRKKEDVLFTVYSSSSFEAIAKKDMPLISQKIGSIDLRIEEETASYNSHSHENPAELQRWGMTAADGLERTKQIFMKLINFHFILMELSSYFSVSFIS